jgi:uncharacterized membrane protein YphA (DoxX/SURF4 family)
MPASTLLAYRISLSALWIFTAITSVFFAPDIGYQVLSSAGITGELATVSIWAGSLVDLALGIWLLSGKKLKACCMAQLVVMTAYTLILTVIAPHFWLHPFGPLTKNIPIGMMINGIWSSDHSIDVGTINQ